MLSLVFRYATINCFWRLEIFFPNILFRVSPTTTESPISKIVGCIHLVRQTNIFSVFLHVVKNLQSTFLAKTWFFYVRNSQNCSWNACLTFADSIFAKKLILSYGPNYSGPISLLDLPQEVIKLWSSLHVTRQYWIQQDFVVIFAWF